MDQEKIIVNLPEIVGIGYGQFWKDKHRYLVLKGGRGSKKSKTASLRFIKNIMKYPLSNLLCIRRYAVTHRDSTFADLQWATTRLKVAHLWKFTTSPMEAVYLPTGQKILFRGVDDPLKITSITVAVGFLCWHWWEEAFEIEEESDFETVDETLRGIVPEPLWKQTTLTYNPWVNSHWTKTKYWDNEFPDTGRYTTTHKCNEWLDQGDHDRLEALQVTNPMRYRVVGLGEYGIPGGNFFEEFREDIHVVDYEDPPLNANVYVSIDYGLDMLAAGWYFIKTDGTAVKFKELHEPGLVISEAVRRLREVNGQCQVMYWYAPPDLWATNAETGRSQQEVFWDSGKGIMLTMSKNARVTGWAAVAEWIHPLDRTNVQTEEPEKYSRLVFTKNCRITINHLSQIKASETRPNDCDTEPHYLTHICDETRGFCVMRNYPPVSPQPKKKVYDFDEDIDRRERLGGGMFD